MNKKCGDKLVKRLRGLIYIFYTNVCLLTPGNPRHFPVYYLYTIKESIRK